MQTCYLCYSSSIQVSNIFTEAYFYSDSFWVNGINNASGDISQQNIASQSQYSPRNSLIQMPKLYSQVPILVQQITNMLIFLCKYKIAPDHSKPMCTAMVHVLTNVVYSSHFVSFVSDLNLRGYFSSDANQIAHINEVAFLMMSLLLLQNFSL